MLDAGEDGLQMGLPNALVMAEWDVHKMVSSADLLKLMVATDISV